jgi:hypothetical protein
VWASGVVADEPLEDLASADDRVEPAGRVLEDLALQGRVERLRQCGVSARADGLHGWSDAELAAECYPSVIAWFWTVSWLARVRDGMLVTGARRRRSAVICRRYVVL